MDIQVKQEVIQHSKHCETNKKPEASKPNSVIDLSSSDSDSDDSSSSSDDDGLLGINGKRRRRLPWLRKLESTPNGSGNAIANAQSCKQFWKAGDYDGTPGGGNWDKSSGGMDHVRVHPKFLHSNATSHKWVLGAFAELLDNSLDEVCNGAKYVNIDMVKNKKDGSRMLLIEDNGGGMDPDKMRQCMSLGYSLKSKVADTIGQYGNGFKTSTMRLGADVIVFSRCSGRDGKRPTQSIGLLSYTFLMITGKEDIVVPMLDYERGGQEWNRMIRTSAGDWNRNVETIVRWSPFSSEADLLQEFNQMKDHGTHIIIYNLWEDDQGQLELDFDIDQHDIQIRGVNRDEKNIQMAQQFPNSRHFLTYRHSLRSYASILYLRIPPGFRIILRGKDVEHHNVVNDMMLTQEVTYRPQPGADGVPKDSNIVAVVTIGFVKDAKSHIDVQGFNVYHKNRLIKPFWRLWNAPGSEGRGVIGVLEANFVAPAHDKQGFERTTVLSRLEARLVQMQKTYWLTQCHKIGYAPRHNKKDIDDRVTLPDYLPHTSSRSKKNYNSSSSKTPLSGLSYSEPSPPSEEHVGDDDMQTAIPERQPNGSSQKAMPTKKSLGMDFSHTFRSSLHWGNTEAERDCASDGRPVQMTMQTQSKGDDVRGNGCTPSNSNLHALDRLKEENQELRERLKRKEKEILGDLLNDLQYERDKCRSLETQLQEATRKIEELIKEQGSLIDIFSEEKERQDIIEETLKKKLKDALTTRQELLDKVSLL
ncbi:hypothetical protein F0562_023236 [Nyssa sinensis]|uniref:Morc S5 domain-containing protein n=1 Tax=Nyssa sinensis TaxID=561372 RepID=A0A5J5BHF1_9ASTE|nr:hypothetical protein F0562_023236 [Nyssa sinensis]